MSDRFLISNTREKSPRHQCSVQEGDIIHVSTAEYSAGVSFWSGYFSRLV